RRCGCCLLRLRRGAKPDGNEYSKDRRREDRVLHRRASSSRYDARDAGILRSNPAPGAPKTGGAALPIEVQHDPRAGAHDVLVLPFDAQAAIVELPAEPVFRVRAELDADTGLQHVSIELTAAPEAGRHLNERTIGGTRGRKRISDTALVRGHGCAVVVVDAEL